MYLEFKEMIPIINFYLCKFATFCLAITVITVIIIVIIVIIIIIIIIQVPGVDSAFRNEYQDIPGGKDGLCVGLTTLPP
jgi:hypothetical protein